MIFLLLLLLFPHGFVCKAETGKQKQRVKNKCLNLFGYHYTCTVFVIWNIGFHDHVGVCVGRVMLRIWNCTLDFWKKLLVIWKISQQMIMKYYPACTDLDWIRHTILTFSFFPVKWAKIDKWEWSIATTIRNKKSNVNRVSKMDNTCIYKLICLWKKIRCSQLVYGTVIGNEPSER